jgi:hypothetical protein
VHKLDSKLESLLHTMDLPWTRKREFTHAKLNWLMKNIKVKNENHSHYKEALETIETMLRG